jgi:hypothetical protein
VNSTKYGDGSEPKKYAFEENGTDPGREPTAVGLNATLTEQFVPTGIVAPQLFTIT